MSHSVSLVAGNGAEILRQSLCHDVLMWFVVGMDTRLTGEPTLAGLYGPFESREAAERYRPRVEENGTVLELAQPADPATYPWPDSEFATRVSDPSDRTF